MFDADSYSAATKDPSSVQIILPELESLNIASLSDAEDSKPTRRRRRNNKSVAQVELTTKIK